MYDILGIGNRASKSPGEAEERKVVLVHEPQERRFLAPAGIRTEVPGPFRTSGQYYLIVRKGIAGQYAAEWPRMHTNWDIFRFQSVTKGVTEANV